MENLEQQLLQQLSSEGVDKISQKIGVDKNTTSTVLSAAIPLLVSALANNSSKTEGAESLHKALDRDHDGSILNNMEGFFSNPETANGAGILKHVLGNKQTVVTESLSKGSGVKSNAIAQILQIAAPLVLGMIGKKQKQEGLDTNNLSSFLGGQKEETKKSNPGIMGIVDGLLDQNRDGSSLDDIIGMVGKLFQK
ncbi:MAG: DUF937 domain-containing protein [Ignavibacteriales bacterium]|nr:DUF937 domain-containing protein [Ignavibacteriales bacterium]